MILVMMALLKMNKETVITLLFSKPYMTNSKKVTILLRSNHIDAVICSMFLYFSGFEPSE